MFAYRIRRTVASATMSALVFFLAGCISAEPEPGKSNDWNPPADGGGTTNALDCKPPTACDVSYEVDGVCVVETLPGCEPCPTGAGTFRPGLGCCAGCWAGETCYEAPTEYACGSGGGLCESCIGSERCVEGACSW